MIEFFTNHHGAMIIDKTCAGLVARGAARCIKDSREGEAELEKYIRDEEMIKDLRAENRDRSFGVVVYNNYVIRVDSALTFESHISVVRIWFNKHTKQAGFKISEEDFSALVQTMTVINLLHKLDVSLGGGKDGKITLDKVAQLMTQTISKIAPEARAAFTVQRKNNYRR
jgi:hypothetical protein